MPCLSAVGCRSATDGVSQSLVLFTLLENSSRGLFVEYKGCSPGAVLEAFQFFFCMCEVPVYIYVGQIDCASCGVSCAGWSMSL